MSKEAHEPTAVESWPCYECSVKHDGAHFVYGDQWPLCEPCYDAKFDPANKHPRLSKIVVNAGRLVAEREQWEYDEKLLSELQEAQRVLQDSWHEQNEPLESQTTPPSAMESILQEPILQDAEWDSVCKNKDYQARIKDAQELWEREELTRQSQPENVLQEAERLIYGARRDDYGSCVDSFERIAGMWGLVLGREVSADQVALCLIQLKVARACNDADKGQTIKRDSIVDIAGYAGCLGQML